MSVCRQNPYLPPHAGWRLVRADGAGPFISRIVHRLPDGSFHTWTSRHHRKGGDLGRRVKAAVTQTERRMSPWLGVWAPAALGWWISVLFMVGSACFALASFAGLEPDVFGRLFQSVTVINAVFFAGSIFFAAAGYLQLLEAANADRRAALARGETPNEKFRWVGWQPGQIGWLSAFIQFVGTLLFNINTWTPCSPTSTGCGRICSSGRRTSSDRSAFWSQVGSLFWSSAMAIGAGWLRNISWWIVMVNLLGSIAFMVSAVFAVVLPGPANLDALWIVNPPTCIGAVCFLGGAYLLLPEMARPVPSD